MKATQVVRGLVLLALLALTAVTGASAAPPPTAVTCVLGGTTSFTHAPQGTDSVTYMYVSSAGTLTGTFTWVSGKRRLPTPDAVTGDDTVVADFYGGTTQLAELRAPCS